MTIIFRLTKYQNYSITMLMQVSDKLKNHNNYY